MPAPVVLVTGSTDGIGLETARILAARGAQVVLHGRDPSRLEAAARAVDRAGNRWPAGKELADLSSQGEVRILAERLLEQYPRLDVLINNAGVFLPERSVTLDGLETTFAVNHLAPLLLTDLLLPALCASPQGRIVNVSSNAHLHAPLDWENLQAERLYDAYAVYALSKLAQVLATVELGRRLQGGTLTVNALHPGVVTTKLLRAGFAGHGDDSLADGAATSVHLTLAPEMRAQSGGYFDRACPARMHHLASDPAVTARLYEVSCRLVGIKPLPPR
jgi:NAD(P)-dependent dehydrogenase (short-subunit alcohol dehydrogenase family)